MKDICNVERFAKVVPAFKMRVFERKGRKGEGKVGKRRRRLEKEGGTAVGYLKFKKTK